MEIAQDVWFLRRYRWKIDMRKKHIYTIEQEEWLKENVFGNGFDELVKRFNERFNADVDYHSLAGKSHRLGLKNGLNPTKWKKGEVVKNGEKYRFKKGHQSFNKGKKWDDYMSKEAQEKSRKTQFKKGQKSLNERPIGDERIDRDGYTVIKVCDHPTDSNKNWVLKHRYVYEQYHNMTIPKNHAVVFLDQNKQNFDIDNLYLVNQRVLTYMSKRGLWSDNPQLTKANLLIAELQCSIKERVKRNEK